MDNENSTPLTHDLSENTNKSTADSETLESQNVSNLDSSSKTSDSKDDDLERFDLLLLNCQGLTTGKADILRSVTET